MASKKKVDLRVPNPMEAKEVQSLHDFFGTLADRTTGLYSISTKEVKKFKKVSPDEADYVSDVIAAMISPSNKVASNVEVKNIQAATVAKEQFEKLGALFTEWGQFFNRNAMQAGSYSYQHSSIFESDVESAKLSEVKGAVEIKEKLEGNRKKRNAAAAATRQATAARLEQEKSAKKTT